MESVDILLMDLDGCLYPADNGYTDRIHSNIYQFMIRQTGPNFDDVTNEEEVRTVLKATCAGQSKQTVGT